MKISSLRVKLLHAGGRVDIHTYIHTYGRTESQPDMTKQIVVFHNFANAPKHWDNNVLHGPCIRSADCLLVK